MLAYTLRIELLEISPAIFRRVAVPGSITLGALHKAIQIAMGWENYHLYLFEIGRDRYGEGVSEWNDFESTGIECQASDFAGGSAAERRAVCVHLRYGRWMGAQNHG